MSRSELKLSAARIVGSDDGVHRQAGGRGLLRVGEGGGFFVRVGGGHVEWRKFYRMRRARMNEVTEKNAIRIAYATAAPTSSAVGFVCHWRQAISEPYAAKDREKRAGDFEKKLARDAPPDAKRDGGGLSQRALESCGHI